jgi:hypothetical protein
LKAHWYPDDQRRSVEPGLNALHHAAFFSSRCRSSATRLTSPSVLIRNLERILLHVHPLHEELDDSRLLGREQLVPGVPSAAVP